MFRCSYVYEYIEKEAIIKLEEVYKCFASAELTEFERYDAIFEDVKRAALPTENRELLENVIFIEELRIDTARRYLNKKTEDKINFYPIQKKKLIAYHYFSSVGLINY